MIFDGIHSKLAQVTSYEPYAVARAAGFTVYDDDTVSLIPTTAFLETGASSAYQISRGAGTQLTVEEDINFTTETIRDYNIETGKEEVRQLGELGKVQKIYNIKSIEGQEVSRQLISETVLREPVKRIVAVGTAIQNATPLTAAMGRNRYTAKNLQGNYVERQETYYDLNMSGVMAFCGKSGYTVRDDGANAQVNYTRFICISKELEIYPDSRKFSIMMSLTHRPGSLSTILANFASIDVNLTKLESRPIPGMDFEFLFTFDFEARPQDPAVLKLLAELSTDPEIEHFTFLGAYAEN